MLSLGENVSALLPCQSSEHFWVIHELNFGVDRPGFQPDDREEKNHRSRFHLNPKQISIRLEFDGNLTRQMAKGCRAVSREIRGMGTCHICLLFV
jgi:hypothetical protein